MCTTAVGVSTPSRSKRLPRRSTSSWGMGEFALLSVGEVTGGPFVASVGAPEPADRCYSRGAVSARRNGDSKEVLRVVAAPVQLRGLVGPVVADVGRLWEHAAAEHPLPGASPDCSCISVPGATSRPPNGVAAAEMLVSRGWTHLGAPRVRE